MNDELRTRLTAAESTLASLQRELADLRALASRPEPEPEPAPEAELPWWEQSEPPREEPKPAPVPAPEPIRVREPEPPRDPTFWDRDISFADLVGPKAFAIAGGVVTLLGVVFFFVLAANRGWIGPELRVLLGGAASALVFAGGFWLRRREPASYSSVAAVGAGIAGGYVTLAAATVLYGLLPSALALPVAAAIAALGVGVALVWSSQLVAALGLLGAIGAPALLALDEGITASGTAFVAIVFAAAVVVSIERTWRDLLVTSAAGAVAQGVWLAVDPNGTDWGAIAVAAALAAILLAAGLAAQLRRTFDDALFAIGFTLASATYAAFAARMLFEGDELGIALTAIALVYAGVAAALFVRGGARDLSALNGALALTFGAVAAAQLLSGQSLAIAWAAQAAVLAWLARTIDERRYELAALAYAVLALGHVVAIDAPVTDLFTAKAHPAVGAASVVALAAAFLAIVWFGKYSGIRLGAAVAVPLLGAYAASLGILELAQTFASERSAEIETAFEWGHVAITATLSAVALLTLVVARRFGETTRTAVAAALTLVLAKVVAFDIATLASSRAGWSALALGGALFLASTISHRLARLDELDVIALGETVASAALGAFAAVALLRVDVEGYGVLALAVPFALSAALELRRVRDYATVQLAIAVVAVGAAFVMLLDGNWLVLAWSVGACALALLATASRENRLLVAAHAYSALAVVYALGVNAPPRDLFVSAADPAAGVPAVLLAAAAALVVALPRPVRQNEPAIYEAGLWVAGAMTVYALSLSLLQLVEWISPGSIETDFQRGHVAVSASWAIVGLALLYGGLRYAVTRLRVAGLVLFGVSVAKLFLYDLTFLTSVTRAFSFLAVGALLLLAGFFYQRLVRAGDNAPA
jgi:uncharacterized membrane protein